MAMHLLKYALLGTGEGDGVLESAPRPKKLEFEPTPLTESQCDLSVKAVGGGVHRLRPRASTLSLQSRTKSGSFLMAVGTKRGRAEGSPGLPPIASLPHSLQQQLIRVEADDVKHITALFDALVACATGVVEKRRCGVDTIIKEAELSIEKQKYSLRRRARTPSDPSYSVAAILLLAVYQIPMRVL